MGTVYINARCQKILSLLYNGEDYISLKQIAEETGVSKRSIYYDLCKINEYLSYYGVDEIEVVRGKGILIPEEDKRKIEKIVENESGEESYIFSPTERVKIIYCYILISHLSRPVYIEQLSEYCQVSRNTIFNDLRVVVNQLQEYNLTLEYESKRGYRITGDVISIRALFFMYFNTLLPLYHSGVLNFLNQEPIDEYEHRLELIAGELNTEYVDGVLQSLAVLTPLMYKGARRPYFPNLRKEKIINTDEFRLVQKYYPDLAESEQLYLCLHLLGSRVAVPACDMFDNNADQSVYEITKALVAEFEKIACVIFEDREELERSLFVHINTSLYRYQYGIQIGNPLSDDIIREYPNLFDITKVVTRYLEQLVGLPIPDSEIAYLALHFGAHLKVSRPMADQLRILIVCMNGVSAGNMLRREVQQLLPYAKIVDVVAMVDVMNLQEICDLVISTVKVKSIVPCITVHPILTDIDRRAILNHRLIEQRKRLDDGELLFDIVKKYVDEKDYDNLKKDLASFFEGEAEVEGKSFFKRPLGLIDFLEKDRIMITWEEYRWQDAVKYAGEKLLLEESIEKRYLDNIISQIRYYGPYMFVTQGLLLAHGKPEDGVKHLDVSMTIFKKPVKFSDFHEARILITLAAEDQEKHLKILKDIMTVFEIESRVDDVAALETKEEVLSYLKKVIGE